MTWFLHSADIGGTSKELALDLHESGLPRFWALYLSLFITELFDKGLSFPVKVEETKKDGSKEARLYSSESFYLHQAIVRVYRS